MSASETRQAASERWHRNNKEHLRSYQRNYVLRNKERMDKLGSEYRARVKKLNPKLLMIRRSKFRAKKIGVEFSITEHDFEIPDVCPVLGIQLTLSTKAGGSGSSPSLDRINNDRGYVPGNVRVISNRANKLKNDATRHELELLLEDAKKHERA